MFQEDHGQDFDLLGKTKVKGIDYEHARRIAVLHWIGRRKATRATPIFLVLLLAFGLPLGFWGSPEVIGAIGIGLVVVVYAANRHVKVEEAMAREWAARMATLPAAGTAWVLTWHVMHARDLDVINQWMLIAYWLFGCLAWAWLHTARAVGSRIGWERMQRDFAVIGKKVGLEGATVMRKDATLAGFKRLLDVRGTGKRASEVASDAGLAEQLAAHEGLPPGSVRLSASSAHAGFVEVSTYLRDPWKQPVPHPRAPDFQIAKPVERCSPLEAFPIGKDPETGIPLTFRIADEDGGIHTVIVAGTGGGKTNLINNIVEHLSGRCLDEEGRPLVRITMIDMLKGHKDAANWAPAVHRVYPGTKARPGALAALKRAAALVEERSELNGQRGRSKHVPTAEEPVELIIIDEAASLLNKSSREGVEASKYVSQIVRGGRSEMVILIIAGQRAVLEHLGTSDLKANSFGVVMLPVKRPGEMSLLLPDWRAMGMPDMSVYGGGAKGVVLVVCGPNWMSGRTFELHDMMTVRNIALSRVLPEHAEAVSGRGGPGVSDSSPDPLVSELPADGQDDPDTDRPDAPRPPAPVHRADGDGPDRPDAWSDEPDGRADLDLSRLDAPDMRLSGAVADMGVSVDRMSAVAAWAAGREAARSPAERAELVRLWREHTVRTDRATALPEAVNLTVRDLAIAAGADGFTREQAKTALAGAGWRFTGKETINGYLRVLVHQGYLERLERAASGRGGRDRYKLATRGNGNGE